MIHHDEDPGSEVHYDEDLGSEVTEAAFTEVGCGDSAVGGVDSNYVQQLHEFFNHLHVSPVPLNPYTGPGHTLTFLSPQQLFLGRNTYEGPPGANVFIFHLPADVDNLTLYLLFRKFGDLLSARVMVDLRTGFSKGYGFVSFTDASSAKLAVQYMDGFSIGRKRLKVAIKKKRSSKSSRPPPRSPPALMFPVSGEDRPEAAEQPHPPPLLRALTKVSSGNTD